MSRGPAGDLRRDLRRWLSAQAGDGAIPDGYPQLVEAVRAGRFGDPQVALGWFHEAFFDGERRRVFAEARGEGRRIDAAGVVAASRVYTPDHIVAFLLQNSLGAWWAETHPESPLTARWPFLVKSSLKPGRPAKPLRDLTLLDPCCGCGAFMVPAFKMLADMYAEERQLAAAGAVPAGWPVPECEVGKTIVGHNLRGADLDAAAVAIAEGLLRELGGPGAVPRLTVPESPVGSLSAGTWGGERFDIVVANPPYVGFRMLDAAVKAAVRREDPHARSDLAVAFVSRCFDLLAPDGLCATVTPAAWLASRDALPVRDAILSAGGPRATVALGQRVFDQAPLLFVGLSVVARGWGPDVLQVLRPAQGSGAGGLAAAAAAGGATVPHTALARLPLRPFLPAAPTALLVLAGGAPRVGDLFTAVDGIWTGSNARDTRYWWEVGRDDDGWRRLSGGQGNEAWAAPIRMRIRAEHAAGRATRAGVEYARVAGGRLAARAVTEGTMALAGVVTLVPNDGEAATRVPEVLAIFNSRIGLAWLQTLTSGLNFNPGYAAQIPLAPAPPPPELVAAVATLVRLRAELATRDPTADTFVDTCPPWVDDDLLPRIDRCEVEVERLLADHLGLDAAVLADMTPVRRNRRRGDALDDHLGVRALRALGFAWPFEPAAAPRTLTAPVLARLIAGGLEDEGAPAPGLDLTGWVERRFLAAHTSRFRRRPVVERLESPTRFRIGRAGTGRAPVP